MRRLLLMALALAIATAAPAAPTLAQGPVILTVGARNFDRDQLEKLPQTAFATATPWTDGVNQFAGPLLRDVLAAAGVAGSVLTAVALNDYKVSIPAADAERYPVIVAIKRNGEYMPVRDKGPLWIVYPLDSDNELRTAKTHAKMIWQLRSVIVD